jgi:cytoskeletal protein CcmA (bactofilin family)
MQENTSDTGRMPALSPSAPTERKIAVLGPTLRFKGDLSAEEDFIFQGRIQGSIHHTQRIIVGTQGVVHGNILARVVVVDGNVEGDLYGKESVVVHETGRVHGNIYAPRVGISDGAVFNGRIDMSGTVLAEQNAPQAVPQAAAAPAPTPTVVQVKRVETPVINPGQPMSAEETEKILTPKVVTVLPPPPRKVG